MSGNLFITGPSAGIGLGLAQAWLERGGAVYGISRRRPDLDPARFHWQPADLAADIDMEPVLAKLVGDVPLELAVLNAGVAGDIADLRDTDIPALEAVLQVNLWGCKRCIDALLALPEPPRRIVAISSGAAITGHRGWGGYALSKAALNMLIQLYAAECPDVHFSALAPGLVDTAMQEHLRRTSPERSPVLARLRQAQGTADMPLPAEVAPRLLRAMDLIRAEPSGCFRDLRSMSGLPR